MFSESLKKKLSLPAVTIGIILLAILVRIFFQVYFLDTDNDKTYQILAAQNFLSGNGFSLHEVLIDDLSNSRFIPLIKWPPGYSLLLTPFLTICKNNVVLATLLLDALTCILFIFFARKLLLQISVPIWLVNLYTLIVGFFLYSFCLASSTDLLALTIYMVATYYTLKLADNSGFKPKQLILVSVLLFLTAFTRYLYLPVVFIIPTCLALIGLVKKDTILFKKGLSIFVMTGIFIFFYLFIQSSFGEGIVYIRSTEKGVFINTIGQIQPFILSSFFNLDYFHSKLISITSLSFERTAIILTAIQYILLLLLLIFFTKWIVKKEFLKRSSVNLYIFIGALSSLTIIGLLLYLSITHAPYKSNENGGWTYVHESRYFAFPVFFLQQLLFFISYHYRYQIKKNFQIFFLFCFLLLLVDLGHNIYFAFNSITKSMDKIENNIKGLGLSKYIDQITKKLVLDNSEKKIVVIAQPAFLGAQAGFYQPVPALYHHSSLSEINIKTKKEVLVLFITNNLKNMPQLFVTDTTKRKIGNYGNYNFYTLNVNPD